MRREIENTFKGLARSRVGRVILAGGVLAVGTIGDVPRSASAFTSGSQAIERTLDQKDYIPVKVGEQIPVPEISTSCFLRKVVMPGGNRALAVVTPSGRGDTGTLRITSITSLGGLESRMQQDSTEGGTLAVFPFRTDTQTQGGVTGFNAFDEANHPIVVTFRAREREDGSTNTYDIKVDVSR